MIAESKTIHLRSQDIYKFFKAKVPSTTLPLIDNITTPITQSGAG
jgi:hypothetical protein